MRQAMKAGLKSMAVVAALALASVAPAQDATAVDNAPALSQPMAAAAAPADITQPDALAGYTRSKANPEVGQPRPKEINFQAPVTPVGHQARFMTDYLLNPVIIFISLLVVVLLLWCSYRYRAGAVETPSKRAHNVTIEVIWTLVPALILLALAFPSFRLVAKQYNVPGTELTLKVTGHQWYWSYEYPDYGDISFDSIMLEKDEAEANGDPYLLDVDNRIVVPVGKVVKVLITASDVIHSFAVPSLWVKMDAVPGIINQTWFQIDKPGVYYGQCSELCGTRHAFMPIAVEALSEEDFKRWVRMKQKEDGIEPTGPGIAIAEAAQSASPDNSSQANAGVDATDASAA